MLIIPNTMRGRRRRTTHPAPAAPVLVAATFLREAGNQLRLTFDRAVTVSDFVYGHLCLYDGEFDGVWYKAYDPTFVDPTTIIWELSEQDAWSGAGVTMTATPPTGIVAADDGAIWAGTNDLLLPFP